MRRVLVAPLGHHPVIVTAAVDALARRGVNIDIVHLLTPCDPAIQLGALWLGELLSAPPLLRELPFQDANSERTSIYYLQALQEVLEEYEYGNDEVHLLLAGARKQMSALTAILAQFFAPTVKGLYHLLDRHEDDPRRHNLFTIDELQQFNDTERRQKMHPPGDDILFFDVPFPHFKDAGAVRRHLRNPDDSEGPELATDPGVEEWYRRLFQHQVPVPPLEVWLSETAHAAFMDFFSKDGNTAENFRESFRQMQYLGALRSSNGMHGTFSGQGRTFHFFKRRRTPWRPFYYTAPDPVHLGRGKVERVVICGLSVEQGNGQYSPSKEALKDTADTTPRYRLADLPSRSAVLLAPLGKAPMVVTQAVELLRRRQEYGLKIEHAELLYPGAHPGIRNLAQDLREAFRWRGGVTCGLRPITDMENVGSSEDCEQYLREAIQSIDRLRQEHSGLEVHLLLSGGRKVMAAMNLFAAQRTGLTKVWHTLLQGFDQERRIEEAWRKARSKPERHKIWFLQDPRWGPDSFDLFPVPVWPLAPADPSA